jgi:hypothetical protein
MEWTLIIGAKKFFIASRGVVYSMLVGERRALSNSWMMLQSIPRMISWFFTLGKKLEFKQI